MLHSLSKQWSWPDMDGGELFVHLLLNLTVTATSIIWRVKTNYLLTLAVIYWNNPAGLISDWISVAVNLSAFHTVPKEFFIAAVYLTTTGKPREDSWRRMKERERHGNKKINSSTFCFCQFPVVAPLLSLLFPFFALSPVSDESFLEG